MIICFAIPISSAEATKLCSWRQCFIRMHFVVEEGWFMFSAGELALLITQI